MESRKDNSIRNAGYAVVGQALCLLASFINRRVFVQILSEDYLGIHGLLSNVLSILSLAEMGFGTAVLYCLYRPVADNDTQKIKALMQFYKRAYRVIGFSVLALGLGLKPFLRFFVGDIPDVGNLDLIYCLYVVNSGVSYFLIYKRSLVIADQKRYLYAKYHAVVNLLMNAVQMVFLWTTRSFIAYVLAMIAATVAENIAVSLKCDRLYPYLKEERGAGLHKEEKAGIMKNVRAMMYHKVGDVVVNGTDNLLIAAFCGVAAVGLYSNYLMIRAAVNGFLTLIYESVMASFGNLNATSDRASVEKVFDTINFLSAWMFGFCSTALFVLLNPFIRLWLGEGYLFDMTTVGLIVANFYLAGMRQPIGIVRNATGLFWNDRYKAVVESLVNLAVSLTLARRFGLIGVLVGTTVSTLTISGWVEPYVVYKNCFHKSTFRYFAAYAAYASVTVCSCAVTYLIAGYTGEGIAGFALKALISAVVPNAIYIAVYLKTTEFQIVRALLGGRMTALFARSHALGDK